MDNQDLERQQRLQEFFKSNPPIWDDLVAEMEICLTNAQDQIDRITCPNREYYVGYRNGFKDILKFKEQYKKLANR